MDDKILRVMELYPTFAQFKQWAKQLPKPVRRQAKVSFKNYLDIDMTRPNIRPHTLHWVGSEQITKLKHLQGPYGKALFTVWVYQRLNHADQEAS